MDKKLEFNSTDEENTLHYVDQATKAINGDPENFDMKDKIIIKIINFVKYWKSLGARLYVGCTLKSFYVKVDEGEFDEIDQRPIISPDD